LAACAEGRQALWLEPEELTMKRIALLVLMAAALGAASLAGRRPADADEPARADKKQTSLMRKKLEYSQRILEGIATADFKRIRQNAEAMQELARSKAFAPARSTEYRAQFLMFDFANLELIRLAKDENLDGAALAHTQLTLSCVKCHQQLRARAK
jgi:hypothetical protein